MQTFFWLQLLKALSREFFFKNIRAEIKGEQIAHLEEEEAQWNVVNWYSDFTKDVSL